MTSWLHSVRRMHRRMDTGSTRWESWRCTAGSMRLQREDHAVTVAEVKDIMDEAMAHSQKVSAKKLVKRVLGKNTDDADRIILTEKDFNI